MFFRNITAFRFPRSLDLSELEERLAKFPLKPVGPLEMASHGFVSPLARDAEALTHVIDGRIWLALGGEEKILPGAVVNEYLAKAIDAFEEKQGRKPGGRVRKQLKDDVLQELLPKAFVKPVRIDAIIDTAEGLVLVNTSSRKAAEEVVSWIRTALGSFPALPLNAEVSPRGVMTGWIAGEPLPDGLTLGEESELKDPSDQGAIARVQRQDLRHDEITRHLDAGKQTTKLALNLDDHVSFVLGEDLILRKVKLLDGALDALEKMDDDDHRAELDARFALFIGETRRIYAVLGDALKLSYQDDAGASPAPPPRESTRTRLPAGVDSVTISAPGSGLPPVTLSAEAFSNLGETLDEYTRARELVLRTENAGVAHLQRHMKWGYNRAARLIEALELEGVISPPGANGHRTIIKKGDA